MPCPSDARQRNSRLKSKRRARYLGKCVNCGRDRNGTSGWRCTTCLESQARARLERYYRSQHRTRVGLWLDEPAPPG